MRARSALALEEMGLAVRFAVMLGERIFVPAASYHENAVARQVLDPFLHHDVGSLFSLVGSGSSIEEFGLEKLDQYAVGTSQHGAYSSRLDGPTGWTRRTQSATKDIAAGWRIHGLASDVSREFITGRETSSDGIFRDAWQELPDRLDRMAFVVDNVLPRLDGLRDDLVTRARLHRIINEKYFQSYVDELEACVFQRLHILGGDVIPSGRPRDDISYDSLLKASRMNGSLARIRTASIDVLEGIVQDDDFQAAFRASQTSGLLGDDRVAAPSDRRTTIVGSSTNNGSQPVGMSIEVQPPVEGSVTAHAALPSSDTPMAEAKPQVVDLAILTALTLEREAVQAVFGTGQPYKMEGDPHIYRLIEREIAGKTRTIVIGTLDTMGNSRAALTSTDMLRSFQPKRLAMVGIAGGCPDPSNPERHVRLGDVVISNGIVEYDFVKVHASGVEEIRDTTQRLGYAWQQVVTSMIGGPSGFDEGWRRRYKAACRSMNLTRPLPQMDILVGSDGRPFTHPLDRRRKTDRHELVHVGVVASADTLLKDPVKRDRLRDDLKAKAIEMEGSGIRDAARARSIELVIFRGVVDYCDDHKSDDWHRTAAIAAAAVCFSVFETFSTLEV